MKDSDTHDFHRRITQLEKDSAALDRIHKFISGKMWNASTIEIVAAIVESTGRKIAPPKESD